MYAQGIPYVLFTAQVNVLVGNKVAGYSKVGKVTETLRTTAIGMEGDICHHTALSITSTLITLVIYEGTNESILYIVYPHGMILNTLATICT